ncbi:MAG: bifunctional phosphoglucose/phosphomannose isomerase [Armatimonadetes bacterium]|nr:bifunctional phosphoglucose/phosphomannose isomerase [Armatimonadota bacterium]
MALFPLDDLRAVNSVDPNDMMGSVLKLGSTFQEGWRIGRDAPIGARPHTCGAIAILGLGGSGIGGDLLRGFLFDQGKQPVTVVKDYAVPAWIGRDTLVLVCSYSGNTEETLAAFEAVRRAGAPCVAITSGGTLARRAAEQGVPVVTIPGGWMPRAALGYLFGPMLGVLEQWKLLPSQRDHVDEAAAVLAAMNGELVPNQPQVDNAAKRVAQSLLGRIPVIYSVSRFSEPAALRWKCQINENSKMYAVWNVCPELHHNETVGWQLAGQPEGLLHVVALRDAADPVPHVRRLEITREVALDRASGYDEVWSRGSGALARLLSLIAFGDVVSVYLAYLNGVDPHPVSLIDELKRRLAGS